MSDYLTHLRGVAEACEALEDETVIVKLVAQALAAVVPRGLAMSYSVQGLGLAPLWAVHCRLGSDEFPQIPGCRTRAPEAMLRLVSSVASRNGGAWAEVVRDGILSAAGLRERLERVPAIGRLSVKEWGLFVATLDGRAIGGGNVLLPLRERPFSDGERLQLGALVPRLAHPLRLASLLASAPPGLQALEHLLSSRADAVLLISAVGHVLGVSPAAVRLLGRHPELRDMIRQTVRRRPSRAMDMECRGLDLQIQLSPCTPRGSASAFLAIVGSTVPLSGRRRLTLRQAELLELLAEGLSNHEIAMRMGLARSTVKTMLERLYRLALVSGRVALLAWARGSARRPASAQPTH